MCLSDSPAGALDRVPAARGARHTGVLFATLVPIFDDHVRVCVRCGLGPFTLTTNRLLYYRLVSFFNPAYARLPLSLKVEVALEARQLCDRITSYYSAA